MIARKVGEMIVSKLVGVHNVDAADMLSVYRSMVLIRSFEEQVRLLGQAGQAAGLVHLAAGQEAANVGVCSLLRRDDYIASHHRGHGHCLAKGLAPGPLLAEIIGHAGGVCGGRSGSMHIFDPENGNLGTNGIVGGGVPLAAGAALSARTRGTDQIAVAFFGDGALNQGLLHECMNMAAIWSLPVLFVCENNGFGEFTAIEDVTAGDDLKARGEVFGIPSCEVDGMDVLQVRAAVEPAVDRARAGDGPSFIICNTYRFGGHHVGDKQDYKNDEEARQWRERDPILRLAKQLSDMDIADEIAIAEIAKEVSEEVRLALVFARASAEPAANTLLEHLYA